MIRYGNLSFVVLSCLSIAVVSLSGCGSKPSAAPTATSKNPNTKSSSEAPTTDSSEKTSPPKTANNKSPDAQTEPQPPVTAPPKKPPTPSAEQLAKWNITDDPPLELLACYDDFSDTFLQCLAVAPDGKQFAVGGTRLTLWNPADEKPVQDLLADYKNDQVERPILSAAISPSGEVLIAGDNDGRMIAWKLSDGTELFSIRAHEGRLTQLAFSPDGKTIATTSYAGEVRLWQAANGARIKFIKADTQEIVRLAFVSDKILATANRAVTLWNVESGEKQVTLTKGNVINPALALSHDGRWLLFTDKESKTQVWDVEKRAVADWRFPAAAHEIAFSPDGKWIASASSFAPVRIWNAANRQVVQTLDTNGARIVGMKWLGESGALAIASELGRVRLWGTPAAAAALGIQPLEQPALRPVVTEARVPLTPAQFQEVIDIRSFPRLPDAIFGFEYGGAIDYSAPVTQAEAALFYRHFLVQAGWEELPEDRMHPGLLFRKQSCLLNVSFSAASMRPGGRAGDLQVTLYFHGNYDVRSLPKVSSIASKSEYGSYSHRMYRAKSPITDVEVALLKEFHAAGWTPYTRLGAAFVEEPHSRSFSFVQAGSELTVSIGYGGDGQEELFVQTSLQTLNKTLPIPPDSGWIEFDASTDLQMVANTKMSLEETIAFYDKEMALDGWLARQAGRHLEEKEKKAWLPYIRGQQDVTIRLVSLPDGRTRAIVGEADRSSYQLVEPKPVQPDVAQDGIEAADFALPKGSTAVQFASDDKQIQFESAEKPSALAKQFIEQMEALGWKRDNIGFLDDEYSFVTYEKGKAEIALRARGAKDKTSASISGDGLLWTKPLPMAAVRVSYETWLIRNRKLASLEHLDAFAAEMATIPRETSKPK